MLYILHVMETTKIKIKKTKEKSQNAIEEKCRAKINVCQCIWFLTVSTYLLSLVIINVIIFLKVIACSLYLHNEFKEKSESNPWFLLFGCSIFPRGILTTLDSFSEEEKNVHTFSKGRWTFTFFENHNPVKHPYYIVVVTFSNCRYISSLYDSCFGRHLPKN